MGPWSPNWRPDPSGRRLAGIRAARRGAAIAAGIFGALVTIAVLLVPAEALLVPAETLSLPSANLITALEVAAMSVPGLALLGAGLTGAALGSRASAAMAGLAMGVGVPVAAVTSVMIGAFVISGFLDNLERAAVTAGEILRGGVTAAVWISPLIALGSVAWVVIVRRIQPRVLAPIGEAERTNRLPSDGDWQSSEDGDVRASDRDTRAP
jgi:hypothetical protein